MLAWNQLTLSELVFLTQDKKKVKTHSKCETDTDEFAKLRFTGFSQLTLSAAPCQPAEGTERKLQSAALQHQRQMDRIVGNNKLITLAQQLIISIKNKTYTLGKSTLVRS